MSSWFCSASTCEMYSRAVISKRQIKLTSGPLTQSILGSRQGRGATLYPKWDPFNRLQLNHLLPLRENRGICRGGITPLHPRNQQTIAGDIRFLNLVRFYKRRPFSRLRYRPRLAAPSRSALHQLLHNLLKDHWYPFAHLCFFRHGSYNRGQRKKLPYAIYVSQRLFLGIPSKHLLLRTLLNTLHSMI